MATNTLAVLQEFSVESLKEGASPKRFVEKLYQMLEEESNSHLIWWSADGSSFSFKHQEENLKELVSKYFTHENCSTFYRQLNFYSFKRLERLEDALVFQHPSFIRGRKDLLRSIKRLKAKEKRVTSSVVEQPSADKSYNPYTMRSKELMDAIERCHGEIRKLRFENDRLRKITSQLEQDLHREAQDFPLERNIPDSYAKQFDRRSENRSFQDRFSQSTPFQRQYSLPHPFTGQSTSQIPLNNEVQGYHAPIYAQNFDQIRDQSSIQYDSSIRQRTNYPFQTATMGGIISTPLHPNGQQQRHANEFLEFGDLDI